MSKVGKFLTFFHSFSSVLSRRRYPIGSCWELEFAVGQLPPRGRQLGYPHLRTERRWRAGGWADMGETPELPGNPFWQFKDTLKTKPFISSLNFISGFIGVFRFHDPIAVINDIKN